ncbi:MAG: NUDIX domain-containing protein [bacterium]|nr:NUDIX domain-containing protein [bacterium]
MSDDPMERRQRVSAYGVVISGGMMLLARIAPGYPGAGNWTLPGGGLDWGEAPDEAIHRELYEETGLAGVVDRLLGIDSLRIERNRNGRHVGFHALRIIYEVTAAGEPRVTEIDGSVSEAGWLPLNEMPRLPTTELVASALRMLAAAP